MTVERKRLEIPCCGLRREEGREVHDAPEISKVGVGWHASNGDRPPAPSAFNPNTVWVANDISNLREREEREEEKGRLPKRTNRAVQSNLANDFELVSQNGGLQRHVLEKEAEGAMRVKEATFSSPKDGGEGVGQLMQATAERCNNRNDDESCAEGGVSEGVVPASIVATDSEAEPNRVLGEGMRHVHNQCSELSSEEDSMSVPLFLEPQVYLDTEMGGGARLGWQEEGSGPLYYASDVTGGAEEKEETKNNYGRTAAGSGESRALKLQENTPVVDEVENLDKDTYFSQGNRELPLGGLPVHHTMFTQEQYAGKTTPTSPISEQMHLCHGASSMRGLVEGQQFLNNVFPSFEFLEGSNVYGEQLHNGLHTEDGEHQRGEGENVFPVQPAILAHKLCASTWNPVLKRKRKVRGRNGRFSPKSFWFLNAEIKEGCQRHETKGSSLHMRRHAQEGSTILVEKVMCPVNQSSAGMTRLPLVEASGFPIEGVLNRSGHYLRSEGTIPQAGQKQNFLGSSMGDKVISSPKSSACDVQQGPKRSGSGREGMLTKEKIQNAGCCLFRKATSSVSVGNTGNLSIGLGVRRRDIASLEVCFCLDCQAQRKSSCYIGKSVSEMETQVQWNDSSGGEKAIQTLEVGACVEQGGEAPKGYGLCLRTRKNPLPGMESKRMGERGVFVLKEGNCAVGNREKSGVCLKNIGQTPRKRFLSGKRKGSRTVAWASHKYDIDPDREEAPSLKIGACIAQEKGEYTTFTPLLQSIRRSSRLEDRSSAGEREGTSLVESTRSHSNREETEKYFVCSSVHKTSKVSFERRKDHTDDQRIAPGSICQVVVACSDEEGIPFVENVSKIEETHNLSMESIFGEQCTLREREERPLDQSYSAHNEGEGTDHFNPSERAIEESAKRGETSGNIGVGYGGQEWQLFGCTEKEREAQKKGKRKRHEMNKATGRPNPSKSGLDDHLLSSPVNGRVGICFKCKGSVPLGQMVACSRGDCNHVFHWSCSHGLHLSSWRRNGELICPQHVCYACGDSRGARLWRCQQCPIAVHKNCSPWPEYTTLNRDKPGWAICWRHAASWKLENQLKRPTWNAQGIFRCLPLPDEWQDFSITPEFIKEVMDNDKEPPPYFSIRRNVFLIKKKRDDSDDGVGCNCGSLGATCADELRVQSMSCSKDCKCFGKCCNKPFRKDKRLKVVKTERCGWGAEAAELIKKDDFVIEYTGEVIDDAMCEKRLWEMKGRQSICNFYICEIGKDFIIDATKKGNASRYLNHSCQPNCKLEKWRVDGETRAGVFALRDIAVGEPLTYDYKYVEFGTNVECRCGAPNCRGALGERFPNHRVKSCSESLLKWGYRQKRSSYMCM